jgi:hypothetical protein
MYIKSLSLPPQPILDVAGQPVQQPVPLNGAGQPLTANQPLVYVNVTNVGGVPPPGSFSFTKYKYTDFTQLFA